MSEYIKQKKLAETSHVSPGAYEPYKPFGATLNRVTMGSKYRTEYDSKPGPGHYSPDSGKIKPSIRGVALMKDASRSPRSHKFEKTMDPAPGSYDGHIKPFGYNSKAATMGGKYKTATDSNPAPGQYDPEGATALVKPKTKGAIIVRDSQFKLQKDLNPEPGRYDGHIKPFGKNDRNMTLGGKYKHHYDTNPAPGQYEVDTNLTKPKSTAAKIVQGARFKK